MFPNDLSLPGRLIRLSCTSYLHNMMDGQALNGSSGELKEMRKEAIVSEK